MDWWQSCLTINILTFSATNVLELTMSSTLTNSVTSDFSSKLDLCVFMGDKSIFLIDWICLSHTPPIRLANGEFFFCWIQSALFWNMNSPSFFWLTSFQHLASSFSLCSYEIASFVLFNCSYIIAFSSKPSKCQYKGACVHTFSHFNIDGTTLQTCKESYILL